MELSNDILENILIFLPLKNIIHNSVNNIFFYKFIRKLYKNDYIKKLYFPKYQINNYHQFINTIKINYYSVHYVNKRIFYKYIKNNIWSNNFFKYKYLNKHNKEDSYIHNVVINIMKSIYIVDQLSLKEDNDKYLYKKNNPKQFLHDMGICYYMLKEGLLCETEYFKKDLDNYLINEVKSKHKYSEKEYKSNLSYLIKYL